MTGVTPPCTEPSTTSICTFGIFDVFPDESGREAHLAGPIASALMQKADELLSEPPSIQKIDILASKLGE